MSQISAEQLLAVIGELTVENRILRNELETLAKTAEEKPKKEIKK